MSPLSTNFFRDRFFRTNYRNQEIALNAHKFDAAYLRRGRVTNKQTLARLANNYTASKD